MEESKKSLGKISLTAEGAWDLNNNYDILSIVYDEHTQHGFISRKVVPQGVDLYNKEYWMPLNVSGYADNNIIILSEKTSDTNIKSYTLEEAINSIASVGRKPGAILGFYNENSDRLDIGGRWELWQFNSTTISEWEDISHWQNIYYNYNKFVGWYNSENALKKYNPFPEIGCYAFVGTELNEATIYRCDKKYVWNDTTQHAWDYVKVIIDGTVTVGENGNWFNNGIDTNIPASIKGENGKTPIFRNNNNIIEFSYDNESWRPISDEIAAWFRLENNKLQISRVNGVWETLSDYIAAWFRWESKGGQQTNSTGKIQITRDGVTWIDLSGEFINNLRISRYIGVDESLPTGGIAEGTIYAKGPTYADGDTSHANPIYRLWVYAWKGNTLAWQDNGEFQSIAAGVVQETGNSETQVMSQKAVTEKFSELGLEVDTLNTSLDVETEKVETSIYLEGKYVQIGGLVGTYEPLAITNPIPLNRGDVIRAKISASSNTAAFSVLQSNGNYVSLVNGRESSWTSPEYYTYRAKSNIEVYISYNTRYGIEVSVARSSLLNTFSENNEMIGNVFNSMKGKTLSIVGDSISTYKGYSDSYFYPYRDVDSVEKTWWYKFILMTGATFGQNTSVSGARITNGDKEKPSLITQVESLTNCDVILLSGGQNDYQSYVKIGSYAFDKEITELDDSLFAQAYDHYVRIALSKASKVICIVTSQLTEVYKNVIVNVANHYNLTYCDLTDKIIDKAVTSHPNFNGMAMMAEYVFNSLFTYTTENKINRLNNESDKANSIILGDSLIIGNIDGNNVLNLTNKYMTGSAISSLEDNSKRLSNVNLIKLDKSSIINVTMEEGVECIVSFFPNKESTTVRTFFIPYFGGNKTFKAEDIYALFTFKKTINGVEQDILPDDISYSISIENNILNRLEDIEVSNNRLFTDIYGDINLDKAKNLYSSTGNLNLSYNDKRLSLLVEFNKGDIVEYKVNNGYILSYTCYSENNVGSVRKIYDTDLIGGGKIVVEEPYILFTLKREDDSVINIDEIVNLTLTKEIKKEIYNSSEHQRKTLDIYSYGITRGTLVNNSGNYKNLRDYVTQLIPINPQTTLKIGYNEIDDNLYAKVFFYKVESNSDVEWCGQYEFKAGQQQYYAYLTPAHPNVEVIVPPTANSMRLNIYRSNDAVISHKDLEKISVSCTTQRNFTPISNPYTEIKDDALVLDSQEWVNGTGRDNSYNLNKATLVKLIKVNQGEHYLIRHKTKHHVYNFQIWEYADPTKSNTYTSYKDVSIFDGKYKVPYGINYIRFSLSSDLELSQDICNDDKWTLFRLDSNKSKIPCAKLLWEWNHPTSYAQGMACQNGYAFCAFADGYIDIYNIETKDKVGSIFVPLASDNTASAMHCNNLTFGDKYSEDDEFGILWVNNETINTKMVGVRVTVVDGEFAFEKVYEVTPPILDAELYRADDQYIDFANKMIVQMAYRKDDSISMPSQGYGDAHIEVYSFDGDFSEAKWSKINEFELPIMWAVQGGRLIDGFLYVLSGVNNGNNCINIINTTIGECISVIDLKSGHYKLNEEPQGLELDGGKYITTTKGFYELM